MITLGTILSKSIENQRLIYEVNISLFKAPGSIKEPVFNAVCATNPGTYEPYKVGDIVYVGFVNNMMKDPVIIGKVQKDVPSKSGESSSTYQYLNSLEVTGTTKLSKDTTIGDLTYSNLRGCISSVGSLSDLVKSYDYAKFTLSSDPIESNESLNAVGVWIDDKPIYRKTFRVDLSSYLTSWSYTIDLSELNYDMIWIDRTHTFVDTSDKCEECTCYIDKTSESTPKIVASGGVITGEEKWLYITIEYTLV